jgi:streptogramin lyase
VTVPSDFFAASPQRAHEIVPVRTLFLLAAMTLAIWVSGCQSVRDAVPRPAPESSTSGAHHPVVQAVTALIHDDPADNPDGFVALSISGVGFGRPASGPGRECGWPHSGAFLEVSDDTQHVRVPSTDRQIVSWQHDHIVVKLRAKWRAARVRVCAVTGASDPVGIAYYTYDHYDLPPTADTNPGPLAVGVDAQHRVWINEEFHLELKYFDPSTDRFTQLPIPAPPDSGPFALTLFGEQRTQISQSGEALVVDPSGRIWITQGGAEPYAGTLPDHSRVVSYDPHDSSGDGFRIYNIPGDHNGVFGLAWDAQRRRVWFTEAARQSAGMPPVVAQRARLVSFDPERIAFDNHFDFTPSATCRAAAPTQPGRCSNATWRACFTADDCVLAEQVCAPDVTDDSACYHEYELPETAGVYQPGQVVAAPDGAVWYTAYWGGNHIGRLDPESGRFIAFPLPAPVGADKCNYQRCTCESAPIAASCFDCCLFKLFGTAPWDIKVAANGDLIFSEYMNGALGRFDITRLSDPVCQSLDELGRNPCIDQRRVRGRPLVYQVHSIAFDRRQNVWFTEGGPTSDPQAATSVGVVKADWTREVVMPPLSLYPFYNSTGTYCPTEIHSFVSFIGTGIAIDPVPGDIWFADYCRKRLGRLRALSGPPSAGPRGNGVVSARENLS